MFGLIHWDWVRAFGGRVLHTTPEACSVLGLRGRKHSLEDERELVCGAAWAGRAFLKSTVTLSSLGKEAPALSVKHLFEWQFPAALWNDVWWDPVLLHVSPDLLMASPAPCLELQCLFLKAFVVWASAFVIAADGLTQPSTFFILQPLCGLGLGSAAWGLG